MAGRACGRGRTAADSGARRPAMAQTEPPQTLLVDADDTLWENHAYFLEVLGTFLDTLEERGHDRSQAHAMLRRFETERIRVSGYGSHGFAASLVATLGALEPDVPRPLADRFAALGAWIFDHPVEVFPGVPETLEALGRRHRLLLVTKGHPEEQARKIDRSGLRPWFEDIEILREKDARRFEELRLRRGLEPARTWMIGNSPASDINPARAVGFRTVYIPHRTTWEVEAVPFLDGGPDLELRRFADLGLHF